MKSETIKPLSIYGIDIGVYNINRQGNPLASTTFAWAKLDSELDEMPSNRDKLNDSISTGRDLSKLANLLESDIENGKNVAVGFEAPMWIPAPLNFVGPGSLFGPRFDQERHSEWYLQSGAAATAKALVIGKLLWSTMIAKGIDIKFTTSDTDYQNEGQSVHLFEGFVVGKYKTNPQWNLPQDNWDALCTAFAYASETGRCSLSDFRSYTLNCNNNPEIISHWETIVQSAGFESDNCTGVCKVVALERLLTEELNYG